MGFKANSQLGTTLSESRRWTLDRDDQEGSGEKVSSWFLKEVPLSHLSANIALQLGWTFPIRLQKLNTQKSKNYLKAPTRIMPKQLLLQLGTFYGRGMLVILCAHVLSELLTSLLTHALPFVSPKPKRFAPKFGHEPIHFGMLGNHLHVEAIGATKFICKKYSR